MNARNPNVVSFEIAGHPESQGSKVSHVPTYGNGEVVRRHKDGCPGIAMREAATCDCPPMVTTREDNPRLETWRETVGWHARQSMGSREKFDGLLEATFVFIKPRPKAHYGSGRNERILKDSAPAAPGTRPDALKLARAIEDAMTNVVYTDDSLIVTEHIGKRFCDRLEAERVIVYVRLLDVQTVGDMVEAGILEPRSPEDLIDGDVQLDLLDLVA